MTGAPTPLRAPPRPRVETSAPPPHAEWDDQRDARASPAGRRSPPPRCAAYPRSGRSLKLLPPSGQGERCRSGVLIEIDLRGIDPPRGSTRPLTMTASVSKSTDWTNGRSFKTSNRACRNRSTSILPAPAGSEPSTSPPLPISKNPARRHTSTRLLEGRPRPSDA